MNYTTSDYLEQLVQDRDDLVDNLTEKGITGLTGDETFTELVPEVLNIPSGADPSDIFDSTVSSFNGASSESSLQRAGYWYKTVDKLYITDNKTITEGQYLFQYFNGSEINGLNKLNTSSVTNMNYMFRNCDYITKLDGIETLDLSNTTQCVSMFQGLGSKVSTLERGTLDLDLTNWNVSNVLSTEHFLKSSRVIKSLNISGWDLKKNTSLKAFFDGCRELQSINLTNVQTRDLTNMDYMFRDCSKLTEIDLSSFETPNLTSMYATFQGCTNLTKIDMRKFNFSNITGWTDTFTNVPTNCLIIVADDTQKGILTNQFPTMTNIKTVAEL